MRHLRDAPWLTEGRAAAYRSVLAIMLAISVTAWVIFVVAEGGVDRWDRPLGPDFAPYWTAAILARRGDVAAAYDVARHFATERALFGGLPISGPTPFVYPPVFLLICLPFTLLPYLPALFAWVGLTGAACWRGVRAIWPGRGFGLPVLIFPGFFINAINGQNGLLSAALFAAGALSLERRPMLAGVCYGCLAYKPHLAIAVPFALLAARAWPALLAGAVTALALAALSVAVFGLSSWSDFLSASATARAILETGAAGAGKMASVFAAAQVWQAGITTAYLAQAVVAVATLVAVSLASRVAAPLARGAAIAAAAPLISPYLFDYDLAIIAVPLAWTMREAERTGHFLPWEKIVLLAAFTLPLTARALASLAFLPVAPLVSAALLSVVLRRSRLDANAV